jgi:hypothetical protein
MWIVRRTSDAFVSLCIHGGVIIRGVNKHNSVSIVIHLRTCSDDGDPGP